MSVGVLLVGQVVRTVVASPQTAGMVLGRGLLTATCVLTHQVGVHVGPTLTAEHSLSSSMIRDASSTQRPGVSSFQDPASVQNPIPAASSDA